MRVPSYAAVSMASEFSSCWTVLGVDSGSAAENVEGSTVTAEELAGRSKHVANFPQNTHNNVDRMRKVNKKALVTFCYKFE